MAETSAVAVTSDEEIVEDNSIIFRGAPGNLVPAVAMLVASLLAFSMGMTDVFFAEATAWTFLIWGILLLFANLMSVYQTFEVTDEALVVHNPVRFWGARKEWDWQHIHRLEVLVKRRDGEPKDAVLQVFYTPEGEIVLERDDRVYDADLAALIIERADLTPDAGNPVEELAQLPIGVKGVYTWN